MFFVLFWLMVLLRGLLEMGRSGGSWGDCLSYVVVGVGHALVWFGVVWCGVGDLATLFLVSSGRSVCRGLACSTCGVEWSGVEWAGVGWSTL